MIKYDLNESAFARFVEYRKTTETGGKRKEIVPLTKKAQETTRKWLMEFDPGTQAVIIRTSMDQGWRGLFRPKGTLALDDPKRPTNEYAPTPAEVREQIERCYKPMPKPQVQTEEQLQAEKRRVDAHRANY